MQYGLSVNFLLSPGFSSGANFFACLIVPSCAVRSVSSADTRVSRPKKIILKQLG